MRWVFISTMLMTAELGLGVLVGTILRRSSDRRAPRPVARPEPRPQLPPLRRSRSALVS